MDIKSLILIAGGVMIVAVIVHGIWIAWKSRRETIRMDIIQEALPDDPELDTRYPAELPNGGARVIGVNDSLPWPEKPPILMTPSGEVRTAIPPVADSVNAELLGSSEGFVTENRNDTGSSERRTSSSSRTRNGYHPGSGGPSTIEAAVARKNAQSRPAEPAKKPGPGSETAARESTGLRSRIAEVSVSAAPKPVNKSVKKGDSVRDRVEQQTTALERVAAESAVDEDSVVSFFLMARSGTMIEGERLWETFRDKGIRRGEMSIFHRMDPGSKMSLYSVANAVNPGTFDFANLKNLWVPGVVFFMQLEGLDHPVKVFEDMRRVAQEVAVALNCEIKDENRSVVTGQTFDHYRERIAEYARRRLSRRAL